MKRGGKFEWFRDKFLVPAWSRYVVVPFIGALPGALLTWWFKHNEGNTEDYALKGWEATCTLAGLGWAGIVTALRSSADEYARTTVDELVKGRAQVVKLLGIVRSIVGEKAQRFNDTAHRRSKWTSGHYAFLEITQPLKQMHHIVESICLFFREDAEEDTEGLTVSLMRWSDKRGQLEFCDHYPPHSKPHLKPHHFADSTTAAGKAFMRRTIVIVEDVDKSTEFKKITQTEKGSMFAYPVINRFDDRVVFVVNVCCERVGRFKVSDAEVLTKPMQVFADRLLLEDELLTIRSVIEKLPVPENVKQPRTNTRRAR